MSAGNDGLSNEERVDVNLRRRLVVRQVMSRRSARFDAALDELEKWRSGELKACNGTPNTQAHIAGSVTSPTELTLFCDAVSRELKRFIESADNRETLEAWALADICHASHLLDIFHDQAIVREIEVNP
jgi:hypothetical protein